ncbi:adenosylmethionine decarboxylase [Burkholderia stagnalis]|uniref:adenosylmethionine decarboxylase n=1 Tax=Burkholderia stagnalis TaxID=1503054 RepID=UPI000F5E0C54|nr:adenosylmethionine decarboxylase [Burkholderia stagnalis]RQX90164.1 adenosylmethionine decarboxylase [Burkholderia stagnalis]RQY33376.1 adenosylmethionine decarboxylase [Burkholderia stagnalis]RQY56676.1 adenosylmethionine decarboxylase [Burkholderia stagnalis]RQY86451.1 adenosylmethionine decarboxylase [Burkholderia stagnalis]
MDGPSYLACGRHVFVDISDTNPEVLNDLSSLERALTEAAVTEGVTVLGVIRHAFQPSGVTILLLLAESHVSLHTYPEQGKAFFDAFTCGVQFEPANIFHGFARASDVGSYRIVQCDRGDQRSVK